MFNNSGVMGMVETAMRDPVFYRWHLFVNNFFAHPTTDPHQKNNVSDIF